MRNLLRFFFRSAESSRRGVLFRLLALLLLGAAPGASTTEARNRSRPPIIPAWAFGHWVWEDTAHTREAVEYLVNGYLAHGIPVGAVLFDSPWSEAYNDFSWNTAAYPRPQDLIDDLHARGIKVVTFYTGAINRESSDSPKQKCDSYDFVVAQNFAINGNRESKWWKGPCVHVDFTNPAAVAWWQTQVAPLHRMGINGAKIDSPYAQFGKTIDTSIGTLANREFGYHYLRNSFDYHVAQDPEFVCMTYAWSGMGLVGWPATSHVNWVGDFQGDWKGMKDQLREIYRSAQEGFSGLACEIGGFWRVPSTKEQFIRYTQMSCFMPIMINGGQFGALEHHLPWRHDNETIAVYREFVLLHHDLAPYLFSAAVDVHQTGGTLVRNSSIEAESHQLGPWLFVKPITSEEHTVRVQLPDEGTWIDLWTGARHAAGATVERDYPFNQCPVFVRAGAILPVGNQSRVFRIPAGAAPAVTFALYPAGATDYVWHQPTGTGTAFRDIRVGLDTASGLLRVRASTENVFRFLVHTPQPPTAVHHADAWAYDEAQHVLHIEKRGREFELKIEGLSVTGAVGAAP